MRLTKQQEDIVSYVTTTKDAPITLVSSIAGSGKTTLLVAIANSIKHTNGMYLGYSKAIVVEAATKFPNTTRCVTTHSLAYRAIVSGNSLKVGFFNPRDVVGSGNYDVNCRVVDTLRGFCLSGYVSLTNYCKDNKVSQGVKDLVQDNLEFMGDGLIECTHDFYLKMLHLQLADGLIEFDEFDFIMLDEAGDLTEVTLEIFKLLPSKRKIAVGDKYQNIFAFNNTINCFEVMKDYSKIFTMSTSFRVNTLIAKRIQRFMRRTLDEDMLFEGVSTDGSIKTTGFLTRTNASLVQKMLEMNELHDSYSLVRKANEIFKLPLMVASLKRNGKVKVAGYAYVQDIYDTWYEDTEVKLKYKNALSYLMSTTTDDVQLNQAIKLVLAHGASKLFDAYREAKKHEGGVNSVTLATAHSVKGLEFDSVIIDDTLNSMVLSMESAALEGKVQRDSQEYKDVMYLYYVACSRAKKKLTNATHLDQLQTGE